MDTDVSAALALKTWAVVGCSPDPSRDSHGVAAFLQREGYRVVPVHPSGGEILGEQVFGSLADVDVPIDVVDVFRRSDQAAEHVDEAIAAGARAVWLQLGVVVPDEVQRRARDAGLAFVQDRCPRIELPRLRSA